MTIRVLVVDDDVPTRVGVRTILSSEREIEVVGEAASATDAIALARQLRPDVVLMDVRLPDDDGIAATRRILDEAREGLPTPHVLVLTTFDYDDYVLRSLQAGARGFLLKRTRAEDLVDAVRTVAEGNALPAPTSTRALRGGPPSTRDEPRPSQHGATLTQREGEVLALVARGLSNAEIADHLTLSIETIRTHVKHVYSKTGARDRAQAVIVAYEMGLAGNTG